jgi:uncharacterized membrane protein
MHVRHESELFRRARRRSSHRLADAVTRFAGSTIFVWLHVAWFSAWMLLNTVGPDHFDPFPYGLIVSLEAIFLSTFVLITQNREAQREEIRAQLDFETNVRTEAWVEALARASGIDPREVRARAEHRLELDLPDRPHRATKEPA